MIKALGKMEPGEGEEGEWVEWVSEGGQWSAPGSCQPVQGALSLLGQRLVPESRRKALAGRRGGLAEVEAQMPLKLLKS